MKTVRAPRRPLWRRLAHALGFTSLAFTVALQPHGAETRDEEPATVRVAWRQLTPEGGPWRAHDLWRGGLAAQAAAEDWQGTVPRHGFAFLRLERLSPP